MAELAMIIGPIDFSQAIQKAEEIEMAGTLPQQANIYKRLNSHFEGEGGSSVEEEGSMLYKPANPTHLDCRLYHRHKRSKLLCRLRHLILVEENTMPNAIIATGMDTFSGNVHLHHVPASKVEGRIVVDGTPEDTEVDTEEGKEVVVEDHNSQLELL